MTPTSPVTDDILERIKAKYPTQRKGWAELAVAIQAFLPPSDEGGPSMAAGFIANAVMAGIDELPGGPFGSAAYVSTMAGNPLASVVAASEPEAASRAVTETPEGLERWAQAWLNADRADAAKANVPSEIIDKWTLGHYRRETARIAAAYAHKEEHGG